MLDNFLGSVCQSLFMSSFLRIQNPSVSSRFRNLRITSWQYFLRISIHEISRQDTRRCYFKSRQHQRGKSHPRIHSFECFSRKVSSSLTHWNLSQITILETWTKINKVLQYYFLMSDQVGSSERAETSWLPAPPSQGWQWLSGSEYSADWRTPRATGEPELSW